MKNIRSIMMIVFIVVAIIAGIIISIKTPTEEYVVRYVEDLGYKFDKTGAIYQKIVTNNSLDEYYRDVNANRNSEYLEYYFSVNAYTFIELRMIYKDGVSNVFNVISDLRNDTITYTYEITKDTSSAILEGEYDEDKNNPNEAFTCRTVSLKKLSDVGVPTYCNNAATLLDIFLDERERLLNNEKFKESIMIPKKEIILEGNSKGE